MLMSGQERQRLSRLPPAERFWSHVQKGTDDECWLWTGSTDRRGYGRICWPGGMKSVTHVALELAGAEAPNGRDVCHRCDNPSCVNPRHLFLGTRLDNMRDAVAKGRMPRGEQMRHAKLTDADVLEARRLAAAGKTQKAIGEMFGIDQSTVSDIVHRKTWAHLPREEVNNMDEPTTDTPIDDTTDAPKVDAPESDGAAGENKPDGE